MNRTHHHGEDQLLKVSCQLRLQIMNQILQNKTKKHKRKMSIESYSTWSHQTLKYHKTYLPISGLISCNHGNSLLVGATSQKFDDGVLISACLKCLTRFFCCCCFFKGNNTNNIESWMCFLYSGTDQILSWLYEEPQHPGEGQPLESLS